MDVSEILEFILPFLETAGRYTREIQERVESQSDKGIGTSFADALTDGDLSVQGFIEVALLSKFPELRFYGEEFSSSLNTKYFRKASDLTVILDPIDGTLLFKDGRHDFSVILGVLQDGVFQGAICLIPCLEVAYIGIKDSGVWRIPLNGRGERERYTIPKELKKGSETVAIYDDPEIRELLIEKGFTVLDAAVDYPANDWWITTHSVLAGELAAWVSRDSQAIDAAALGFLAEEAGGVMTDFKGEPLRKADEKYLCGPMISSHSAEFHARLQAVMNEFRL